jgi:hypothetical protein
LLRSPTREVSLSSARSGDSLAGQQASAASLPTLAIPSSAASETAPRVELVGPDEPQVTLALPAPSAQAEATPRARTTSSATSATNSITAKPSEKKTTHRKTVNCNPPWTMNEQHIKVFKAECLR